MPSNLRKKLILSIIGTGISITLLIFALLTGILKFGRSAGNFESKVLAHENYINENKEDIKKIPILATEIVNAKNDRIEIKSSLERIENILLKSK